jgi:peptidoglycan hydrolase-like protein with peptidoglycan-binding domain
MRVKVTLILGLAAALAIVGLLPALSRVVHGAPIPAHKAAKKAAAKAGAAVGAHAGTVKRQKAKSGKAAARLVPVPAATKANAEIPEGERLGIQSDLAFVGLFDDVAGGDLDERAAAAVTAFQQRHGGKPTGILTTDEREQLAAAAKGAEAAVGWRLIEDTATGALLGLPEKLVSHSQDWRTGTRWSSAQGQIRIETFRFAEAALPALFDQEKKSAQRRIEWSVLKPDSFVIEGVQGLKNFLVRVEAHGSELRGVTILYDQATAGIMSGVALAVAGTFRGFPDPNGGPLPGLRRSVEYTTGIVASSDGAVLASATATEACQAITVPPLGYADRVAVDKANGLALLRLYGARNLAPAPLAANDGVSSGDVPLVGIDVTLVGIADPLGQGGGDAVTSVEARLSAPGLEPAPKLGFAGAAAVDAAGHVIGMVDVKAPVVAAVSTEAATSVLVPASALRAFLRAQDIALTPVGETGIARSVVRVICVRK